uniref:DUF4408 domain-containing protein n=1 Tax=Arundo donax TaxID=35708 RepID=A0A0A9HI02_ARUDO
MDVQRCIKVTVLALTILSMATWFPRMYFCIRTFFMESLPSIVSAAIAPKCLFVFSNIIVVFLVSESKRSRRSAKPMNTSDNAAASSKGDTLDGVQEEEVVTVTKALLPMITAESKQEQGNSMVMVVDEEENTSAVNESVSMDQCEVDGDHFVLHEVDEVQGGVEEQGGELDLVLLELQEVTGEVEQECAAEEELEERDLPPADVLNRRVEDFIARFNMERQLEARMLVCCC